jgi:hypothetical protein
MNPLRLGIHSLQRAALAPPPLRAGPARAAAFFHSTRRRADASRPGRYGTAKEPPPHLQEAAGAVGEEEGAAPGPMEQILESVGSVGGKEAQAGDSERAAKPDVITLPSPAAPKDGAVGESAAPSESVLNVGKVEDPGSSKLPHLHPPPYMHHFDTWTLVRDLEEGGFTEAQAVTTMKAVRLLLTKNMDLARDALVSKSNVENVRGLVSEMYS